MEFNLVCFLSDLRQVKIRLNEEDRAMLRPPSRRMVSRHAARSQLVSVRILQELCYLQPCRGRAKDAEEIMAPHTIPTHAHFL